ncbi:MAG: polysaccharide biosynthesis tyrosine autokinase [Actinomycetota bacterium]
MTTAVVSTGRRNQALDELLASSQSVQDQLQTLNRQLRDINAEIEAEESESKVASLEAQANTVVSQIAVLQQQLSNLTPPDTLRVGQVLAPAELPASPARPNHLQNAGLAIAAGLAAGVGVAFARERLDDRLRGRDDLEAHLGAPVLAVVPRVKTWKRRRKPFLAAASKPDSAAGEAYRTLRTGILFAASSQGARTIVITSPHPGDGKTATTANLGVALARAGKRVAIVSADLRKPRLHRFFGLENRMGLATVLIGEVDIGEVLEPTEIDNLQLVPSGPVPANPGELLGSDAMSKTLIELREVDFILIDSAPALAVADTLTLGRLVDAVLFVVDAEHTTRKAVDLASRQLERVHAKIIGAVLNNFDPSKARTYTPDYGYYSYSYKDSRRRSKADKSDDLIGQR